MTPTGSTVMEKSQTGRSCFRTTMLHHLRAVGLSAMLAVVVAGPAFGQQTSVSGVITSAATGAPIAGVAVAVQGSDSRATTNAAGRYVVSAPATGTLIFTRVGQRPQTQPIGGRSTVNISMIASPAYLDEVVVTGYTEGQRRADITGAVASINVESAQRQTSASVLQKLDVVPGITVAASGSPGSRSTVRIRGISSFQNNEPLYVIDGVPVQDSYINFLNPNDITSIQVLKDASSASIYGSRASNGVIVIETTKRGPAGPPRTLLSVRTGIATPTHGYDEFLLTDALAYFQVQKQSFLNAGLPVPTNIYGDPNNPTIPAYTFAATGTATSTDAYGRPVTVDASKYSYPNSLIMPGSAGTNWWKSVFSSAPVADYNLSVSGSGEQHAYGVSGSFFNQEGTAAYNNFKRGSIRANTSFTRGKLSFGENAAVAAERSYGGIPDDNDGFAENGIIGKNILLQPVVPVYDIQGNFASGKATTLGNQGNPLKDAFEHRNDLRKNNRVFGNVFAGLAATSALSFRTSFGFNLGQLENTGYNPITPENSEPNTTNSINENSNQTTDWTFTNTMRYVRQMSQHNFNVLLGQEANAASNRLITASIASLKSTDVDSRYVQDALGDAGSKNVTSTGAKSALLSYFGKLDYNFDEKYVASVTLRRDGSSRLGPEHRWGTFPAFGAGWRISRESFLKNNKYISDAMLRVGYGVTGNQLIPPGRIVSQFGGALGDTYYDITGSNSTIQPGFRQTSLGNADLKWEENRSTNVGADVALFDGAVNVVLDVYERNTNNLLFDPALPATAGLASPPIVNIGKMKNTGFDLSLAHSGTNWSASVQGSRYKNKIVSIDGFRTSFDGPNGQNRLNSTMVINKLGEPIGSFYGLVADGFFRDAADVTAHAQQDGAAPGRIKFRDVNGDGRITQDDRDIIGSPHPDFTASMDLGYRRGNWDLNGTVFGSFGNDIFDAQKDFYVFQDFSTNVRDDLLQNSWTPTNQNAKYPRLDKNDSYSRAVSSFYVEDGSYVRLRNLQLGYTVPPTMTRWLNMARVYVQAENLFTFTGYSGLDPSLPTARLTGAAGDIRDQYRGVDRGVYPTSKVFSVGLTTTF